MIERLKRRIQQLEAENRQLGDLVRELEQQRTPFRSFSDAQAYWLATVSPEEFERIARGLSHAEYEAIKEAA